MPRTEVFDRTLVLNHVQRVFWNKGFNGTSMQDLVDATGLNRSSIYNSFGSKKALYLIVLKQYHKDSKQIFQGALSRSENPLQAIRYIFEDVVGLIKEDEEGKGCFNMNCKAELARSDDDIRHFLSHSQDELIHLFSDLIEEGQRDGIINERDTPENYAYYLFSAFQGIRMTGILTPKEKTLLKIVDNSMQALI